MPALDTALTLEAVVDVAVLVSHDLDLDVAGVGEVLFDQEVVASEGAEGFRLCHLDLVLQCRCFMDDTHTLSSTSSGSLQEDGEFDPDSLLNQVVDVLVGSVVTGDKWDGGLLGSEQVLGCDLSNLQVRRV